MADLNPFFDLVPKRIDELLALLRRSERQLACVASPYIMGNRVMVATDQRGRVSKTVRQIVGCQDLHDLLGPLHPTLLAPQPQ